jgi:uncharacterized cupin superfamily protein
MNAHASNDLIFSSSIDADDFTYWDIEELGVEVIEGDPNLHVAVLRDTSGQDGAFFSGIGRTDPSTFSYTFAGDETFHVLEGEVSVSVKGAGTIDLGPGDVASFAKGGESEWVIKTPMKNFFVLSSQPIES